jgi:hypothetical protein
MYADKVAACKTEVAGALETFHNGRAMRVAQFPPLLHRRRGPAKEAMVNIYLLHHTNRYD